MEKTQALPRDDDLWEVEGKVWAEEPGKDIHSFAGSITFNSIPTPAPSLVAAPEQDDGDEVGPGYTKASYPAAPLTAENMLWANTVLAAGSVVGMVVYTGKETRAVMNTSQPGTKTGLLDLEINRLAKVCFFSASSHF